MQLFPILVVLELLQGLPVESNWYNYNLVLPYREAAY